MTAPEAESKESSTAAPRPDVEAAVALFIAYYNFCRAHSTIKTTPAVKSGLANHVWSVGELLTN